jgi:hypothetical protein
LKQKQPRFEFRCVYYRAKTSDTYKLKKHIKREKKDRIITYYKQKATSINTYNYYYLIILLYK